MGGVHSEIRAAMLHEHIELLETARVKEPGESFPRCQLSFGVLCVNALLPSSESGRGASFDELCDFFFLYAHTNYVIVKK